MNSIAIRTENLSKLYHIGQLVGYHTLRESLMNAFHSPFRRARATENKPRNKGNDYIWALKDVSFEVKPGEVVGIIGRNGAGKTTLLRVLSRITEPTSGYAEVHGRIGSLLEVGTGFHPELTGRENVYLNGAVLGMKKKEIDRKFTEIVDFSGVEKFIDTPLKRYSSGMQVRLAFAVAAHLEPEILIVDEVLAVGDAEFQKKSIGKMNEVARGGRTVLFVSHNMLSLQNLCNRGILLESGRVVMDDAITTVIDKYLNMGAEYNGEVSWASPEVAPGNERARLKAVRVVSGSQTSGVVDIDKEFRIEVDYWNLEANGRRLVSIHLTNSMGVTLFTPANLPSASLSPDPWYERPYPIGLFRTSCTIPGNFLNDGLHSISVFINATVNDNIITMRDILPFMVQDTGAMRKEFTGRWLGAIRPRLNWQTNQLN
ncbi:MAG: ATP-binding cassette domain-containing protein [Chloroflexi bacterium]|nr:ATP-binding cassette domain-containing protein [Chloroflexota bacterium]